MSPRVPLRRRKAEPAAAQPATPAQPEPAAPTKPSGKGRPTPKRREAQHRRPTVAAPTTRKEANRARREQVREQRRRTRAALASGDERSLPARDAGPGRRVARDLVDARRSVAGLFMPLAAVALLVSGIRAPAALVVANTLIIGVFLAIVVDSVLLAARVKRRVREQHGEAAARGVGMYAVMRAATIRRLRLPPPKVNRGTRI